MAGKLGKPQTKRHSQRGRPPKQDVERYPSGKVKPSETERETKAAALWGRMNIHGIDSSNHKDGLAGSTLGRMFLDGKITDEERKAGEYYADCMARYYASVGIPHPSPRAQNFGTIRGHDGEVSESQQTRARRASNKMMELEGLLCGLPSGRQVKTTVFNLCIMDYENMRSMPVQQLLWLKDGLRALRMHQCLREAA